MTLAVEPPHPRLGSWNTPLQLSGKPGASSVHDPSQGLVQEPDLPADHDRAPRDPLAVTTGVEVLGLHRLAQGRYRGRVRPLLAAEPPVRALVSSPWRRGCRLSSRRRRGTSRRPAWPGLGRP